MKKFGVFNILLVVILSLTLMSMSVFSVINRNFKTADSAFAFFTKAQVFQDLSSLVQLQIQDNYPWLIQDNIILRGIANKLVDVVVTPELVARVAKPSINATYAFAQAPTSIVDNKVVIDTATYKEEAKQFLQSFDLPKFITVNAGLIVDAVSPQLTIVNLEKNPNSVFALIMKGRVLLEKNKAALDISWIILVIVLTILIVHGLRHIKKLLELLWMGFGFAGVFIIAISLILPWILQSAAAATEDAIVVLQQQLISHVVMTLVNEIRNIAIWYVVGSVILFVIWRFVKLDKFQVKVNKVLKKIHMPVISVEVKA